MDHRLESQLCLQGLMRPGEREARDAACTGLVRLWLGWLLCAMIPSYETCHPLPTNHHLEDEMARNLGQGVAEMCRDQLPRSCTRAHCRSLSGSCCNHRRSASGSPLQNPRSGPSSPQLDHGHRASGASRRRRH